MGGTTEIALPTLQPSTGRLLTSADFQHLVDVPPEARWFTNLTSPATWRAYENAMTDFMRFIGIQRPNSGLTRSGWTW